MSTLWKETKPAKFYEALGAIADKRFFELNNKKNTGVKVYSSDKSKFYTVAFDYQQMSIISNDNPSYWQGYLGYPGIVYLLLIDLLPLDMNQANHLKGIKWKALNQRFNNDYQKTIDTSLGHLDIHARQTLDEYVMDLAAKLESLQLKKLGPRRAPPKTDSQ